MINRNLCPNCNGNLISIGGGKLKCECCGTVVDDTNVTDAEKSLLIAASKLLREGKFEEADEAYRDIISENPRNHEAYYGRALAKHGIVFVSDIRVGEGKKVPTCYITDVGSFVNDTNYKKALEFAPDEVKEDYEKQGKLIENIITEWKNKASKENYDVFISFKASEDDTGEPTADSVEATKLYTFLTTQNFKVFFAPVTLKAYTSERYEPYIFNAINQAPVMIVYGQSQEHMEATWVRNEWSRFIKKIQTGEKQANGLVVCYEKMTSRDLPIAFKNIQCVDASEKTCYIDLVKHINKVLEKSRVPSSQIQTVQTEFGKVGKKASKMNYQEIRTYSLGTATVEKVTETDELILEGAKKFFKHEMYDDCLNSLETFLAKNEYNYEANLLKLFAKKRCKTLETLIKHLDTACDLKDIRYLLTIADKKEALHIIKILYDTMFAFFDKNKSAWVDIFKMLVELDFPENKQMRREIVDRIIASDSQYKRFEEFICYIDNSDIDYHLSSRLSLIKNHIFDEELDPVINQCINEVSEIDEGNVENLTYKMYLDLGVKDLSKLIDRATKNRSLFISDLEEIFKYSKEKDVVRIVKETIDDLLTQIEDCYCIMHDIESKVTKDHGVNVIVNKELYADQIALYLKLFDDLIKYMPLTEEAKLVKILDRLTKTLFEKGLFETCISYCNILLNYAPHDYKDDVIYLILLCKSRCMDRKGGLKLAACKNKLNSYDEWNVLVNYKGTNVETELFDIFNAQSRIEKEIKQKLKDKESAEKGLKNVKSGISKAKKQYALHSILPHAVLILINLLLCFGIFVGLYKLNLSNEGACRNLINALVPFSLIGALVSFALLVFGERPTVRNIILGFGCAIVVLGVITQAVMFTNGAGAVQNGLFKIDRITNLWILSGLVLVFAIIFGCLMHSIFKGNNFITKSLVKAENDAHRFDSKLEKLNDNLKEIDAYFELIDDYKSDLEDLEETDNLVLEFKNKEDE